MNAKPVEKYVNAGAKGEGGVISLATPGGGRYPGRTENIMPPHHGLQQALPAAIGTTDRETQAAWRSTRLSGPPT